MRIGLFLAGALLLFGGMARAAEHEKFHELTVDQVDQLIQSKGADIFDNNTKDDWKNGHVPTAKWVSFKDVKESDLPKDKDRELVFYCHNEK
jgi:rhodanese-related sulfurtransferase